MQPATSNQQPVTSRQQSGPTRTPKQILILGTNGTGKSTAAKKLVVSELQRGSRALVVVPDDMEWPSVEFVNPRFPHRIGTYVGVRKIVYFPGLIEIIRTNWKNGLIVFDDCRAYFDNYLDRDLHSLLIRRRQHMADIVLVTHGFTDVPPKFFTFTTHYILYKTIDGLESRKTKILNYPIVLETRERINQRAADTQRAWTKSGLIKDNVHYSEIIRI